MILATPWWVGRSLLCFGIALAFAFTLAAPFAFWWGPPLLERYGDWSYDRKRRKEAQ